MSNIVEVMPAVALRGTVILPDMIVHFDISRPRSIKAVEKAMLQDQRIFLITQKDPDVDIPGLNELYKIGTIGCVKQVVKLPQNILRILVEGVERGELLGIAQDDEILEVEVAGFSQETGLLDENVRQAMVRTLKETFRLYCVECGRVTRDLAGQIMAIDDLEELVDQISIHLPLDYTDKQSILEATNIEERHELLNVILNNEIQIAQIRQELQVKVRERVDKNQKEYILKEQLKLIQEELGEDNPQSEVDEFRKKLKKLEAPDSVKEKIAKEIDRFKTLAGSASESAVVRGYIETLLDLPWDKMSQDSEDLKKTSKILEADHYGLEKVKERIVEYLAVRTLTKKGDSPILCLVGPPGTGKTSIAKSVANALNKKYVRICLGGVRDEAEIRGHRRTYVGAMPGRIAVGLKQAGVKNPLMLLDEIDKTSSDYKGDTASALLEVLDAEQNDKFTDHYVEIPLDLSQVLFIATANDASTIPRPLLDRMELIEISSYTENEKEHIAKDHLIPKQREMHGLKKGQLTIQSSAVRKIVSGYTKEAGVRNLERKIGEICRKVAREVLEGTSKKVTVTGKNVEKYLGHERYSIHTAGKKDEVGVATGLAWTSVGGDTLQIEVNVMPGKGRLQLTGQMGDVMKESAQAGISYLRSIAEGYDVEEEFFQEHDVHIHIPEGAVPKDGPSAGITMATAMLSAITERPVRAQVAMTGEITLRGRVLPVGGLKEKLLAAKNAKIKMVLAPKENRPDIREISEEITDGLDIRYVESMEEVLEQALCP